MGLNHFEGSSNPVSGSISNMTEVQYNDGEIVSNLGNTKCRICDKKKMYFQVVGSKLVCTKCVEEIKEMKRNV